MDAELPPGYQNLEQGSLEMNVEHSVIGLVTDYMAPGPSNGPDWQLTFTIQGNGYDSHRVKFFAQPHSLPPVEGLNDVVVLERIKYMDVKGKVNGKVFLSNYHTECTVFPARSMPENKSKGDYKLEYRQCERAKRARFVPDQAVMNYALQLKEFWQFAHPKAPAGVDAPTGESLLGKQGFKLVENVGAGGFYDLLGQVVRLYDNNGLGTVVLDFTDYTSNALLYNHRPIGERDEEGRDGDEFSYTSRQAAQWMGPPGQFTLTIDLWDSHAAWCRANVKENDFVTLKNVQITTSRDSGSKLEGKMRGDRQYPTKVNISKVKRSEYSGDPDEDVKELLVRKRDFIKAFGDWEKGQDHRGKKRKAADIEDRSDGAARTLQPLVVAEAPDTTNKTNQEAPLSKSQKQRAKRRERERAQKAAVSGLPPNEKDEIAPHAGGPGEQRRDGREHEAFIPKPRGQIRADYSRLNPYVATRESGQELSPIAEIFGYDESKKWNTKGGRAISLKYHCAEFATEVRVIDFFPPDLRDFAVRKRISEFDCIEDESDIHIPFEDEDGDRGSADFDTSDEEQLSDDDENRPRRPYRWMWRFSLLVEDRQPAFGLDPQRLPLEVADEKAVFLLKGLEACNLRKLKNQHTLTQLQEKLFILWGNLQEHKEAERQTMEASALTESQANVDKANKQLDAKRPWKSGLTNKPFRCHVKEYGVKKLDKKRLSKSAATATPNWTRRFHISDTVIKF